MENTTDLLQIKISKARQELSRESREAIDAVNLRQIISGMNVKFNSEQLEDLKQETELLLFGLVTTEDFPKELEDRLKITKNEVLLLINELDRLIFKKIQKGLEDRLKGVTPQINKPFISDPRFIKIPKETQEAISMSNWENSLHEIATKYKLSIDKMDPLEKITVKVITGEIETNRYEIELKQQLGLSEDDNHNLVIDIDNKILKIIKENLKGNWNKNEDTVPLPPYSSRQETILPLEKKWVPAGENKNSNINTEENKIKPASEISFEPIHKEPAFVMPSAINMLKDKLGSTTTSVNTVSDYSLPKINNKINQTPTAPITYNAKSHDPYHEEI